MQEQTVQEYINGLPAERQKTIRDLRKLILENLPQGYEEGLMWGGICYYIPLSVFPNTYNKQPLGYICLTPQKNHYSLYLMCVYGKEEESFREDYKSTGKKLDMGKSCVRFKALDDLPLELIAKTIGRYTPNEFIERYKQARQN